MRSFSVPVDSRQTVACGEAAAYVRRVRDERPGLRAALGWAHASRVESNQVESSSRLALCSASASDHRVALAFRRRWLLCCRGGVASAGRRRASASLPVRRYRHRALNAYSRERLGAAALVLLMFVNLSRALLGERSFAIALCRPLSPIACGYS